MAEYMKMVHTGLWWMGLYFGTVSRLCEINSRPMWGQCIYHSVFIMVNNVHLLSAVENYKLKSTYYFSVHTAVRCCELALLRVYVQYQRASWRDCFVNDFVSEVKPYGGI